MSRIIVYRADGTQVTRLTGWQRVKLTVAGLLGAALVLGLATAAVIVGFAIAIPLVVLALLFGARLYWQARLGRRP